MSPPPMSPPFSLKKKRSGSSTHILDSGQNLKAAQTVFSERLNVRYENRVMVSTLGYGLISWEWNHLSKWAWLASLILADSVQLSLPSGALRWVPVIPSA